VSGAAGAVPGAADARDRRVLRVRYGVVGVALAVAWVGGSREPAWEHAVRVVLMLVSVGPLLWFARRRAARGVDLRKVAPGWLVAGAIAFKAIHLALAFGVATLLDQLLARQVAGSGGHDRLAFSAIRVLALVGLVLGARWYERRHGTGRAGLTGRRSWPRFAAAKLAVIGCAVGLQWLLTPLPGADLWVAGAVALAVALLGPPLHPHLAGAAPGRRHPRRAARAATGTPGTGPRDAAVTSAPEQP
jgi:hypothetical protein